MTLQTNNDETFDVTLGGDIAAFVSGTENEPDEETALRARRVLTQAITDPAIRERLLWLRSARADWETQETRAQSTEKVTAPAPTETARLSVLQNRLRETTRQVAGIGDLQKTPGEIRQTGAAAAEKPVAHTLWQVWKTGGGRWAAAGAAETTRSLVEAVQRAGSSARNLTLGSGGGQHHTLSLPCLAPALAAPIAQAAPEIHSDAITTADGVRITFQQSPSSRNRMRVLVDASHLRTLDGADEENRPPYNVAFLTLIEGDDAAEGSPKSHSRHLLVVALNARGTGFFDFSIAPPGDALLSDAAAARKSYPAPRAGSCRLVAATLSQMPPQPETVLDA